MSEERNPGAHEGPARGRGYITHDRGFVPGHAASSSGQKRDPSWSAAGDREQHLHRHYRRRIRNVRMRWFGSGLALGVVAGIVLMLAASALVVTQFPAVLQSVNGEPDVAVVIGESYLNRQAESRLKQPYATGVGNMELKSVNMDLKPDNRMDLQPTFTMQVFTTMQVSPAVKNRLDVQNGKLVINMIGDPQIGSLNIPLELLPFDLNANLKQAINKVNNDLLISEINQSLQAGFGSTQFTVQGVTTTETAMTVRLQARP